MYELLSLPCFLLIAVTYLLLPNCFMASDMMRKSLQQHSQWILPDYSALFPGGFR